MYRYPIGAASLEFPRGGADNGEDLEQAALRELHEETGLVATRSKALGRLHPESGLLSASVVVVRADITGGLDSAGRIEPMESVAVSPLWLTSGEFVRLLTDGLLTCGITIAAWALWRSVDS
jgi:8-oxo-dGTP pyrophosphatase MutT (NUDIX family)